MTAASGATGNQGTYGISLAKVFYNIDIPPWVCLTFMYGIVWTGYSFGAIARNFVLYDPKFVWPKALMQTSLFRTQEAGDEDKNLGGRPSSGVSATRTSMNIFLFSMIAMFLWQFLPEFIFPMLSSLAVLCWMAPYNKTLNFLGSGLGGLGMVNLSLDWSNITSEVMLSPYWTIVLEFAGFAITCWGFLPFAKWFKGGQFATGLMDNHLLMENGNHYPLDKLITSDMRFNQTAYQHYGPIYFGAQRLFNIFFDYAAYTSALAWLVIFGWKDIKRVWSALRNRDESYDEVTTDLKDIPPSPTSTTPLLHPISSLYKDRINVNYSAYEDVPNSWFICLFLLSFIALSYITLEGYVFMPWRTYIVALTVGSIIVTPMAYLYATSNFQLAIGTFNELLYGLMMQSQFFVPSSGIKHPAGASMYGAIAGNCWYRAQYILQDQKIGLYNGIPPKDVFFSQVFGDLIGVPFNYIALKWVLSSKLEYLRGEKEDPLHQWTGQALVNYVANGTQYVLVGPKELFAKYRFLPYGFLVGILSPLAIYWISRRSKKLEGLKHFNTTIVFSTMSRFYGNISTGYLTQFLLGTYTMYYLQNFRKKVFRKYNYVLAAAFDTGFNLCNIAIFFFFSSGYFSKDGRPVTFPNWWGNDMKSIERCYAN
ncbi:DEKNAAC100949 [Brettanomyces naardenensis]|uniref:DEKNAAC100949 n=1 Tax=Brettanomyces naardenensis TaxID=13370 RepID=A0A448YH06_BRENA|nr:DEKNAAC100949 [Brettanomyces naardenensis]